MVWTGQQPAGIARQSRSAQESGKPRSHGSDLGPPVSGVAGAIFEWSLGCDPFRQLCGWRQLWLFFGKGGAEGGLVRVLKQAEPLRTTGTGVTPGPEGRRRTLVRQSQRSAPERLH